MVALHHIAPEAAPAGERIFNELDVARIERVTRIERRSYPPELAAGFDVADIVAPREVPPDVITMNSLFELADAVSGQRSRLMLCYPKDAAAGKGYISVLSPAGGSLLGQRCGAQVAWQSPQGERQLATVVALLFQPEAAGDYTL